MRLSPWLRLCVLPAAAFALCSGAVFGALAQGKALAVHVGAPGGSVDLGQLPSSQSLQLTLFVTPTPDRSAALDQYLADLATTASTSYHKWLTPQDFAARFGATSAQLNTLTGWLQTQGFSVVSTSPSATSLTVSGSAAQVEAAFAPALRQYALAGTRVFAPSAKPILPQAISSIVTGISGFDNLPPTAFTSLSTLSAAGAVTPLTAADPLLAVAQTIDANAAPILLFNTDLCAVNVPAATSEVYANLLRQANAQGITMLATTNCSGAGSFPAGLPEVTAVGPELGSNLAPIAPRPGWQSAPGLPDDADRHEPDFAATDFNALAQTLATLEQQTNGRLGNINSVLYALSPTPGLFYQADGAAAGTWEPSTGLGVIDLQKLTQVFPRGAGSSFASLGASSYSINYGQSDTYTSNVTSGTGGPTPTGTVTFTVQGGGTLCSTPVVNGTATCAPIGVLNGGSNTISASYSGDSTYAPASSPSITVFVAGEQSQLSAVVSTGNTYGGNFTVTVTDTGSGGVGVPTGTVTVTTPVNGNSFPGTLAQASSNSASAVITVPATLVGTITLSISCTATANFKCDNPDTTTVTIGKGTPAIGFSYTPSNATSGQTVNLTATASAAGSGVTPTGNVSFLDNGTVLNAATLSGGTASTTGVLPTTATHSLSATYDGDANYLTANSTTTSTGSSATNTSVTASVFGPAYGASTTITATVVTQSGSGTPTGSVNFTDSVAGNIGNLALNGSGIAALTVSTLAIGSHTITATYAPTGSFTASTSPSPVTIVVVKATPTGTLVVSPNPPVSGSAFTLTATLPATGSTAPTGNILFQDSGNVLGTLPLTGGIATYSGTLSSATTHSFTGAYTGDSNYNGTSLSASATSTTGTATTTTLTTSNAAPTLGSAVTLTAHVTGSSGTPTGNVRFTDATAGLLGTMALTGGTAALQTSTLAVGAHSITAAYAGDTTNASSTSPAVAETVASTTGVATTVTLTVSPTAPAVGQSVIFGANVTPTSVVNNTPPSGPVQFLTGTTLVCSGTLSNYFATCTSTTLPTGTYSVTAVYAGDTNYATGTSTPTSVTVAAGSGSGALTAVLTAASAGYGNTDTVSASVASSSTTVGVAGTVQAIVNGKTYTGTLAAGAATITFDVPPPGSYNVVVSCVAPLSCTGSPVTLPLTSTKGATSTAVTSSSSAPSAGAPITLTAIVASTGNGAGPFTFTGTVAFLDGTKTLGTATVSGNQATLVVTLFGATTHAITAVYSGDTNWFGSTSTAASVLTTALPATIVLTSNVSTALAGVGINFSVTVSGPSTLLLAPSGSLIFYDTFNGVVRALGTAAVVATGPNTSIAAFSITGLAAGTHNVYAVYSGDANFAAGTSNTVSIGLTDYSSTFNPPTLTVTRGVNAQASLVITATSGFSGQISFGCTPPPNIEATCYFSPSVLNGSGITTLTISTTKPAAVKATGSAGLRLAGGAAFALLVGFFLPHRRRRVRSLLLVAFAAALAMNLGCALSTTSVASPVKQTDPGSPLGTAMFNIVTAGTDGVGIIRHDYQYQVTIQ